MIQKMIKLHSIKPGEEMKQSMKNGIKILLLILLIGFEVFAEEWPKVMHESGAEITIYQPQIESFNQIYLEVRAAVDLR
jgi:hypothetical protein